MGKEITKTTKRKVVVIHIASVLCLAMTWSVSWFFQFGFLLFEFENWFTKAVSYNAFYIQPILTLIFSALVGVGFIQICDMEEVPSIRIVEKTKKEWTE